jgi:acyl-CoA synthetase (AMP-forming)/AMP-acid ligase II
MIFSSPHPAVTIPEISLTEFVLERVAEFGDKPAIIDGQTGRSITYAQLVPTIRRLATGLAEHGLTKGDVLAIYSPNLPEFALVFHAVTLLGGVVTMVPPLFTDDEIKTQLRDSGARFMVTIPQLIAGAREAAAPGNIEKIFVIGESEGAISLSSLMSNKGERSDSLNPSARRSRRASVFEWHHRLSQGSNADASQSRLHALPASGKRRGH